VLKALSNTQLLEFFELPPEIGSRGYRHFFAIGGVTQASSSFLCREVAPLF
jgi:hypothetical protein